jgi:C_GCAxxG_C_C family probable redox protein
MQTKEKQELALSQFSGKMNCAQSVLLAHADEIDVSRDDLIRLGAAFGGGMGEGETCGAVSAALMVIGLKNKSSHSFIELKERVQNLSEFFKSEFEKEFGSLSCKDLIGENLKYQEGYERARKKGVFTNRCPHFIMGAIQIIDEIANADL